MHMGHMGTHSPIWTWWAGGEHSVPIAAHAPHTTGTKCCDQLLTSVKSLHCWHGGGEEGLAVTRKKSIASSELLFNSSTFLLPVLELFASTLFLKVNGSQKKSITSKSVVGRSGLIYHLPCFSSLTVRSILLFPWKKCEVWASPSSFFFSPPKVLAHPAPTWKMKPSDFCPYWALAKTQDNSLCQDHLYLKNAQKGWALIWISAAADLAR